MAYNPSKHTTVNKPIAITGRPELARYMYFDEATFAYRPFANVAEVLAYFDTQASRAGSPTVLIMQGGTPVEYWFRNGVADSDLVIKNQILGLSAVLTEDNSAGNNNITNLANPENAQDAATKSYVNSMAGANLSYNGSTDKIDLNGIIVGQAPNANQVALISRQMSGAPNSGAITLNRTDSSGNTSLQSFEIDTQGGMIITDAQNLMGLVYTGDYAAKGVLNDRWIPDWGAVKDYVEEHAGGNYTFENGLRETDGVVKLGLDTSDPDFEFGVLTEDTYIVKKSDSGLIGHIISDNQLALSYQVSGALQAITLTNQHIHLQKSMPAGGGTQGLFFYGPTSTPGNFIVFEDLINNKGVQYAEDYSTEGTLDDRWIPDYGAVKAYVNSAELTPTGRNISAGAGLTGGGTLAADRTIDMGNPSTLSPATSNGVTASSHTHLVTGFMATTDTATVTTGNAVDYDLNNVPRATIVHSASFQNGPGDMVHGFLLNNHYAPSGAYAQMLWEEIPGSNALWWRIKGGAEFDPWYKAASEQWLYQEGGYTAGRRSQYVHMIQCLSKGVQKHIADTALPSSPVNFTVNSISATANFASGAGTNWNWATPIILVIYWGGTGDADTTIPPNYVAASNNTRIVVVRCQMSNPTGANYGNPNALTTARAIYDYMVANYTIAGVVLAGHSMGAVGALNCLTRNIIPNVLGIYLTDPVVSLRQRYDFGGTPKQYIEEAYGIATDGSDYAEKTAGYDPLLERADRFKGVYVSCVASTGDTTIPYSEHLQKLIAKLQGYNNIQSTILSSAGHSQQDRFIGTQWQAFMERVVNGSNGLPTVI